MWWSTAFLKQAEWPPLTHSVKLVLRISFTCKSHNVVQSLEIELDWHMQKLKEKNNRLTK